MIDLCMDEIEVISGGCSDEEIDPVCLMDEAYPCLEI
jgi:hypothetical protein